MRVLVVDDSSIMRKIVKRSLRQVGFGGWSVTEASGGQEALDLIRSEAPDLVLCDWEMPEMGGLEVLSTLRAEGVEVPFGFVTPVRDPEILEQANHAGALFVIDKPFDEADYRYALREVA